MEKKIARVAIAALVWIGLAFAPKATAAYSQLSIGYDPTYYGHVYYQGSGLADYWIYITSLTATRIGGNALPAGHPDPSFETYCLDLGNDLVTTAWWESGSFPNPNLTSNPPWTPDGIYKAAWLYNTYAAETGPAAGAALQLAIWEVLYEHSAGYSLTNGNLYVGQPSSENHLDSAVYDNAARYLTGVVADKSLTATFWEAMDPKENQDLIGPVPEPATWLSAALLVVPFLASMFVRKAARAESLAHSHSRARRAEAGRGRE